MNLWQLSTSSLSGLGFANQFETSKHTQLIGWFNKNFIRTGLIDQKYGKIVNKAFIRRTKGYYDIYVKYDKEIVKEMFFCHRIARIIRIENSLNLRNSMTIFLDS